MTSIHIGDVSNSNWSGGTVCLSSVLVNRGSMDSWRKRSIYGAAWRVSQLETGGCGFVEKKWRWPLFKSLHMIAWRVECSRWDGGVGFFLFSKYKRCSDTCQSVRNQACRGIPGSKSQLCGGHYLSNLTSFGVFHSSFGLLGPGNLQPFKLCHPQCILMKMAFHGRLVEIRLWTCISENANAK